jgi:hypothetical protein
MTHGNIKYGQQESNAIIDEVYNTLKSMDVIRQLIIDTDNPQLNNKEENMQVIEKKIDRFINDDPNLQVPLAAIYHRRNIMIPMHKGTEKNESIDAKKRLIKEILSAK